MVSSRATNTFTKGNKCSIENRMVMIQDDEPYVQVLMKLGLTLLQATIYLTLTKLGKAGVKRISRVSNVARPDVYRVMPALEERGLVERIIAVPTIYKAIPLKEGLPMLLKQKIDEDTELQKETKTLLSIFPENNAASQQREDTDFIITNEKNLLFKKFNTAINKARSSLNFICTTKGLSKILFYNQADFRNAIKRNVEIRIIIKKAESGEPILRALEDFKKAPLFKLKYIADQTPICMLITDNQELNVQLSNGLVPSLWSNNPHIVRMATTYFETIWHKEYERVNLVEDTSSKTCEKMTRTRTYISTDKSKHVLKSSFMSHKQPTPYQSD